MEERASVDRSDVKVKSTSVMEVPPDKDKAKTSLKDSWYGWPLEEVDPMIYDDTFCVITKKFNRHCIQRYSCSKSLFLFGPTNLLRRISIFLTTNFWFDILIILTITCNCITLALIRNDFDFETGKKIHSSQEYYLDYIEYVQLAIFTIEVALKILAKGFVFNKFSYLRNRWNVLDFIVVVFGFITIVQELQTNEDSSTLDFLRTFRVFRVMKTIAIFPGLKLMINALISSVVQLLEVMGLSLAILSIFALFAVEVFQGRLRQKCVKDKGGTDDPNIILNLPVHVSDSNQDKDWTMWVANWRHWKRRGWPKDEAVGCGNSSSSRLCGSGYTCLSHVGDNPDYGWTSFDSYWFAMLATLELLTVDYFVRLFDLVLSTYGIWCVFWFVMVIFLGTYYLLNLMLAVVVMSYKNEAATEDKGPQSAVEKLVVNRQQSNFSFDQLSKIEICKMTQYRKRTPSEKNLLARKMQMIKSMHDVHSSKLTDEQLHLRRKTRKLELSRLTINVLSNLNVMISALEPKKSVDDEDKSPTDPEDKKSLTEIKTIIGDLLEEAKSCQPVVSSMTMKNPSFSNSGPIAEGNSRFKKLAQSFIKSRIWFTTYLSPIVNHPVFEISITTCIVLNTIVLAVEHHGESKTLEKILKMFNNIFMAVFTVEAILKLLALRTAFFQSGWNIFDLVVVLVSYLDVAIGETNIGSKSRGLSVIRSMRLLRIFKLAQSWVTMKVLLNIIFSSFGALGNLICVLFIFLYIFAVMGLQVVGDKYWPGAFGAIKNPSAYPQLHWKDFRYGFMLVFRVLCREWVEALLECLKAQKYVDEQLHQLNATFTTSKHSDPTMGYVACFTTFLPILVIGNFIILNLFLALLLNSFDSEAMNAQREKELNAKGKTENLKNIVALLMKKTNKEKIAAAETEQSNENKALGKRESSTQGVKKGKPGKLFLLSKLQGMAAKQVLAAYEGVELTPIMRFRRAVKLVMVRNRMREAERKILRQENWRKKQAAALFPMINRDFLGNPVLAGEEQNVNYDQTPATSETSENRMSDARDCLPHQIWRSRLCPCKHVTTRRRNSILETYKWEKFRGVCVTIVAHPFFERIILALIFASSITLCFDDINLEKDQKLQQTLTILNYVFTGLFFSEMILKWFAIGIWRYFTSFWTILDGFIVTVSLISLYFDFTMAVAMEGQRSGAAANLGALKALRTLRALRPLRAISRWEGMKIVVNALMYAIPSIFNVLLVCLLFWLIFSIMGVQFFKGQFYRCVNGDGQRVDWILAPNREICCFKSLTHGYTWINTISNFDNVFEGYLSLLQVATYEGWMELMSYSVSATGVDKQPITDYQVEYYGFYVIFVIFGCFFTLQLFIGVIIDNFNKLKKKYEGNMLEMLLTPSQRKYHIAMKNLGNKKPRPVIMRPKSNFFGFFYDIAISRYLEVAVVIMIFLNMIIEALENYGEGHIALHILNGCYSFFAVVYCLEAIVKILGHGYFYFTIPWNVYDFILVAASLMDLFWKGEGVTIVLPIPPTMLRIVRVFRIGRILRLVKAMQGIRKLLFALVVSLPALFNIGALLALITFIYAILGMNLFGKAPRRWSIDDIFNFESFKNSNLMLLRCMTSAGWNEVLESLTVVEPVCGTYRHLKCGFDGEPECLNRALVVGYMVSYLMLTYYIVINLYIAIILENYVEACKEEDVGIAEDDLDMFYVHWSLYDPHATQFINFESLPEFLDTLNPPFRVPKPNIVALVAFNLPIARGNKIHCLDIIQSLITKVLGKVDDSNEFTTVQMQMEHKFQRQFPTRRLLEIVSSTRRWKVEQNAAIIIQRAWRAYWKRTHSSDIQVVENDERNSIALSQKEDEIVNKQQ